LAAPEVGLPGEGQAEQHDALEVAAERLGRDRFRDLQADVAGRGVQRRLARRIDHAGLGHRLADARLCDVQ